MRGEYSGKNGNRDFLGEGNGCGIAWDPLQLPMPSQGKPESHDL